MVAETDGCKCLVTIATGGEEEALAAYEDAMQAIYNLQLDRYSHVQPHRNPETGRLRWECIEMWPMQVRADAGVAGGQMEGGERGAQQALLQFWSLAVLCMQACKPTIEHACCL